MHIITLGVKMVKIDALSKKWSLDVLHALKGGSKRFNEIGKTVSSTKKKISSRLLADRLNELEEEGLILREIINSRPPKAEYTLTKKGEMAIELTNKLSGL